MAEACQKLGLFMSFAGMLTYKKSVELRSVAESISLDRLLIETDSPYLSPEPKRSTRPNEPLWLSIPPPVWLNAKVSRQKS